MHRHPTHLTICECRPPWREDLGPDRTRFPIARLRYTTTTPLWTCTGATTTSNTTDTNHMTPNKDLLDYLDSRADPIFWG